MDITEGVQALTSVTVTVFALRYSTKVTQSRII